MILFGHRCKLIHSCVFSHLSTGKIPLAFRLNGAHIVAIIASTTGSSSHQIAAGGVLFLGLGLLQFLEALLALRDLFELARADCALLGRLLLHGQDVAHGLLSMLFGTLEAFRAGSGQRR